MKNIFKSMKAKMALVAAAMVPALASADAQPVDISSLTDALLAVDIQGTITTAGGVVLGVSIAVALIFLVMKIIQRGASGGGR